MRRTEACMGAIVQGDDHCGSTLPGDISGLIPGHITTKQEIDAWENSNILEAVKKYLSGKNHFLLNDQGLRKLHKDMFGKTWEWAGKYRDSVMNIGIERCYIHVEIKKLCDDAEYRENHGVCDEYKNSARIHHRLAQIHPFRNGNGRHARFAGDIYLFNRGKKLPEWPGYEIIKNMEFRRRYIRVLKNADNGDYNNIISLTRELCGV